MNIPKLIVIVSTLTVTNSALSVTSLEVARPFNSEEEKVCCDYLPDYVSPDTSQGAKRKLGTSTRPVDVSAEDTSVQASATKATTEDATAAAADATAAAADASSDNSIYSERTSGDKAKIDAYYEERNSRAENEKILYEGTTNLNTCMKSLQGNLLGCIPMKHKVSFMKSELRYFPGTKTMEECQNKLAYVNSVGGVTEGICTKYGVVKKYPLYVAANVYFLMKWGDTIPRPVPKSRTTCTKNLSGTFTCETY